MLLWSTEMLAKVELEQVLDDFYYTLDFQRQQKMQYGIMDVKGLKLDSE